MYTLLETEEFVNWFESLKDRQTRARLQLRLRKASLGNLGDHKSVGDAVWEMREFFGPGWRMYFVLQDTTLIFMLGGGSKSTQVADIKRAKALAQELKHEKS